MKMMMMMIIIIVIIIIIIIIIIIAIIIIMIQYLINRCNSMTNITKSQRSDRARYSGGIDVDDLSRSLYRDIVQRPCGVNTINIPVSTV